MTEAFNMMAVIAEMKKRIPKHPLKKKLEELIDKGLSEEEALDVMITAWLER